MKEDLQYYIDELKKDKEEILHHFEAHIKSLEFKAIRYRDFEGRRKSFPKGEGCVESYYDRVVRNKRVYNILKFLLK